MDEIRRVVLTLVGLTFMVFIGLAVSAVSVRTAETPNTKLDAVMDAKVLRVGTTGDYKPFSYFNPDTKVFEGIDIDMAKALSAALGVEVQFVQTKWADLLTDLLADKYDIAMGGVSVSMERQKRALFTIPFMVDGKAAVARCEDRARYLTLADIDRAGVKVMSNPGGTNEKFDRATLKHATIEIYPDNKTIWQQILDGKADLMITDASETRFWEKEHPGLCAIHPDQPFNFAEKAYLLPRDAVWKEFVDQWLHQSIESGEYRTILARWVK